MSLPWDEWQASNPEIVAVAEKFIFANCYSQKIAGEILQRCSTQETETRGDFGEGAGQGIGNPEPSWLRAKEPFNNS